MTKRNCILSKDSGRIAQRTESFHQRNQPVNSLERCDGCCDNYTKGVNGLCGLCEELSVLNLGKYRVIQNDCRGFNNLSYTILEIGLCVFFYLIEQHSKFLLHTLQVLYMFTLCDSTNINTIIEFVPNCL